LGPPHVDAAAGWYADPWAAGGLRWWDGSAWSSFVARAVDRT